MTIPGRRFAQTIALALVSALGWLGGCSDLGPGSEPPPPQGLIVSDPASTASITAGMGTLAARASSAGDEVAYVSLPPGTVSTGSTAVIHRVGDAGSIITAVSNGGFDPVPVQAQTNDSIDVIVRDPAGGTVLQARLAVVARRPPVVVRTEPSRKKTDVPLNAAIVIVFSEPVAGGTVTPSSIELFRGTSSVVGTVQVLEGTGAIAAFVPAAPLAANTEYRLGVTRGVRDLDGDALEAGETVTFTTGQSPTGPAASIMLSPDSVWMTGATYQLTATVRDAGGNLLVDQPVVWSTSDPNGLTISQTGLVTALAMGYYGVTARLNDLTAWAPIYVIGGPPASVVVSPGQTSVGAAGDTISLVATVRDQLGRLFRDPVVVWSSSDLAVATVQPDSAGHYAAFATVTGVNLGNATIAGTFGTTSGTASVTVVPPLPVASVTVTPDPAAVIVQGTTQLSAVVRDANGKGLGGRLVTWTSDNTAVATVDANGVVTGVSLGSGAVIATSEGVSDTAAITVQSPVLAFVSSRDGNPGIFVMNADGSAQAYLTNSAGGGSPAWSPDGQKIAFVSGFSIYVINVGGGARTSVATGFSDGVGANVHLAWSAWSPDGQKIVFSGDGLGNHEVFVANADGSGVIRPTENPGDDRGPVWSPDGQKIAFNRNGEIYVMNADGTAQTRLTNNPAWDDSPAWSPDGQKIAFTSYDGDGYGDIYVMNADGSALRRLTNDPASDGYPAWSPDGQKIAFGSTRDGNNEIYVMNADGSAQVNLTNNPAPDAPPTWPGPGGEKTWSPDGRKIAFTSERDGNAEIYVMDADGTAQTRLTNNAAFDGQPRWRP